jgi:hypothetical protein
MWIDKLSRLHGIREIRKWKPLHFIECWDTRSSANAIGERNGETMFGTTVVVELHRPGDRLANSGSRQQTADCDSGAEAKEGNNHDSVRGNTIGSWVCSNQSGLKIDDIIWLILLDHWPETSIVSASMHLRTSMLQSYPFNDVFCGNGSTQTLVVDALMGELFWLF